MSSEKQVGWVPEDHEPEHKGSLWSHPYMIYIVLTGTLFLFLLGIGWLAMSNGWIPSR